MSLVIRKIQRASAKKKAAKFKFTVTFGELIIDCNDKWQPDKVAISLMHRRRRYVNKPRKPETSFASPSRFLVIWPEIASDFLDVITTLYKDGRNDQFDDKEWTLIVEELNAKGKYRPLAAISLNLKHFINDVPGTRTELKLKLRPLRKEVRLCTVQIFLSSVLLKEGDADDKDIQSIASTASREVSPVPIEHHLNGIVEQKESQRPEYDHISTGIHHISQDIDKWREETTKEEKIPSQNLPQTPPKVEPAPEPTTSSQSPSDEKVRPPWRTSSQERDKENRIVSATKPSPMPSATEAEPLGPPPRPKPRTVLTNKFEEIKNRDEKDAIASPENRISAMFDFGLTEQEEKVMRELEQMRKQREEADAVDFRNVPEQVDGGDIKYEAVHPYPKEGGSRGGSKMTTPLMTRKQLLRPFDSDSDEEKEKPKPTEVKTEVEIEDIKKLNEDIKNLQSISRRRSYAAADEDPETSARREQLRLKARQLLENPAAVITNSAAVKSDEERKRRLHEEARRLIEEAVHDGATVPISKTLPSSPDGSTREPKIQIHQYKKIHPSPVMQRKVYESPLIPACSRPTQRLINGSSNEHLASSYNANTPPNMFDRVRRFGSMRGPELAETIARFVKVDNVISPNLAEVNATPTRKIVSKIESDMKNSDNLGDELQQISNRMDEIERLSLYIREKLTTVEPNSDEEHKFIEEQLKLTQEKDSLVRKQDYFNLIGTLNETTEKIGIVQQKLANYTTTDDFKTEEEKQQIDNLMKELKELVDQKNNLTVELMDKEAEDEEHDELNRLTLERTQNFRRGQQEPLSASKRLMNWIRS